MYFLVAKICKVQVSYSKRNTGVFMYTHERAYLLTIEISLTYRVPHINHTHHMHQAYHVDACLRTDVHHTLSLAMVTVMSRSLILEKIKVNLDFLVGRGFFKKTV